MLALYCFNGGLHNTQYSGCVACFPEPSHCLALSESTRSLTRSTHGPTPFSKFVVEDCMVVLRDVGIGSVEMLRKSRTVSGLYKVSFLVVVAASMRLTPEGHELLLSAVHIHIAPN